MLTRTRRRVVEEEVTEVFSPTSAIEAWRKLEREEREKLEKQERERRERMNYEQNRLDSFPLSWLQFYQLDVSVARRLAKSGFYRRFGSTKCFSCELSKYSSFWREGHDPETVHRRERPNCKFITGQSDNVPKDREMKYEQNRLESFDSYWFEFHYLDISVALRLAKAGFYSRNFGYTECFSCGLCKHWTFWLEGNDPEMVHREETPDCKFITGQSGNGPIDREMKYEQNRLDSFHSGWLHINQLDVSVARRLAKSGFYCRFGNTKCFSCELSKYSSFWLEGHDPETVHRKERPNCKFIKGQSDNVPIDNELQEQREEMKYEQNRLDSFDSMFLDDCQLDVSLAKAGFYCSCGGVTFCFSCGLYKSSSFWQEGHDPETVHRRESPDCNYVTGQSDNVSIDVKQQNNNTCHQNITSPKRIEYM